MPDEYYYVRDVEVYPVKHPSPGPNVALMKSEKAAIFLRCAAPERGPSPPLKDYRPGEEVLLLLDPPVARRVASLISQTLVEVEKIQEGK